MSDRNGDPEIDADTASKISRLFDIRLIVGGLLTLYGIILLIRSAFDSSADIHKAAGIRINLWTGLGMLVVGLLMLTWMRLRPLQPPEPDDLVKETGPRESRAS
jgi:xanthine/uracil/vitamin C permease (AzgA family)